MEYLKLGIIILLLDAVYLSTFGGRFAEMIKDIQGSNIKLRYGSAIACYILIIYMLNHFIIKPKRGIKDAFILGACAYGIYDTVNYATFKKYKLHLAIMDTIWGGILFALTTLIARKL
ncbi:MAG: DUF2177 family protein [Candidatus Thorarchaeota archaeon]|jgi:uncharacterized membrane protein